MTAEANGPPAPDPFAMLRALAIRHIEELAELHDGLPADLAVAERERLAKILISMTKLSNELFDAPKAARKTGDELKKEDDAIRAEFARRLAQLLRGRTIARGAGRSAARAQAEVSS